MTEKLKPHHALAEVKTAFADPAMRNRSFVSRQAATGTVPLMDDLALVHQALRDAFADRIYGRLFTPMADHFSQP